MGLFRSCEDKGSFISTFRMEEARACVGASMLGKAIICDATIDRSSGKEGCEGQGPFEG